MSWCPKCRNEYVEGVTTCPDCDVELVNELPEEYYPLEEPMEDDMETAMEISMEVEDEELGERLEDEEAVQMFSELRSEASSVYVKKKDKYADLKFSGISFLAFGIVGFAVVILNAMGIIQFFNAFSMLIMGIVFAIFFAVGISSLIRASKLKGVVKEEERATEEITAWIKENITDERIAGMIDSEQSEEDNYFTVHSALCELTAENFPFFSKGYIDQLMDDRYSEYCEKSESADETGEETKE